MSVMPPGPSNRQAGKRAAASAAIMEVQAGMLVGLGTGTTMALVIAALGVRAANGLRIEAVATSLATAALAENAGLRLRDFTGLDHVDLAIDGADEVDRNCLAIKGAGGAMLREKIVGAAAARMIAVVDDGKLVDRIGGAALPVEVLPFALTWVMGRIAALGAAVAVRNTNGALFRTDQGNFVLDCRFAAIKRPQQLAAILSAIPGVLGHGLFITEIDAVYVGGTGGAWCFERPSTTVDAKPPERI